VAKIRPAKGFAHFFHLSIIALVPLAAWFFISLDLLLVALIVLLLSKWRIFALHPRHWITHIRANAIDIIAGFSFIILIANSGSFIFQLMWVFLYEVWILYVKSGTSPLLTSAQALIAQTLGLAAVFLGAKGAGLFVYVLAFWLITYFSARHFLAVFDELHGSLIASIWAFFSASLIWVLGHWLIFFGSIAQPALLLTVIGFSLSGLYYLDRRGRLHAAMRKQLVFIMLAVIFAVVVFSDWGDKAV